MHDSIGVDIIELKKAERFYKTHREKLGEFLSLKEKKFVERGKTPHEALAMVLSAKEAVFKALDRPWMGPEGFRKIKVQPVHPKMFSFRFSKKTQMEIYFTKNSKRVVAFCVPAHLAH